MAMNRTALWRHPEKVPPASLERMDAFWGDNSWRDVMYKDSEQSSLFRKDKIKQDNLTVVNAFRERLGQVAGFKEVLQPMSMQNSNRATIYYLFFASHKPVAARIVKHIFKKYRDKGM